MARLLNIIGASIFPMSHFDRNKKAIFINVVAQHISNVSTKIIASRKFQLIKQTREANLLISIHTPICSFYFYGNIDGKLKAQH